MFLDPRLHDEVCFFVPSPIAIRSEMYQVQYIASRTKQLI